MLEPLSGYLELAKKIYLESDNNKYCEPYNFGPCIRSNKTVKDVLQEISKYCDYEVKFNEKSNEFHEASNLNLQIDKSYHKLGWFPKWEFPKTIERTINWYKDTKNKIVTPEEACLRDLEEFNSK